MDCQKGRGFNSVQNKGCPDYAVRAQKPPVNDVSGLMEEIVALANSCLTDKEMERILKAILSRHTNKEDKV